MVTDRRMAEDIMCTFDRNVHKGCAHIDDNMRLIVLAALALLLILQPVAVASSSGSEGLLLVVSFPSLAEDLRLLLCEGDDVVSIVPPGVDPHEYQLRPSDVELIRSADLIITMGDAPVEHKIRSLVESGFTNAKLIEVIRVDGVRTLLIPGGDEVNHHMPLYDPRNLKAFVNHVNRVLGGLRPECLAWYSRSAKSVLQKLEDVVKRTPRVEAWAVADTPLAQYAVSWAGVRLLGVLARNPDSPILPDDLARVEGLLRGADKPVVVVLDPPVLKASRVLMDLAGREGARVVRVPSPTDPTPIIQKMLSVAAELQGTGLRDAVAVGGLDEASKLASVALVAASFLVLVALGGVWPWRRY